jgi:hypothetical protein
MNGRHKKSAENQRFSFSAEREGNEPTPLLIVSQLFECCKMGDAADDAEKF